jgi:hypothetical protein
MIKPRIMQVCQRPVPQMYNDDLVNNNNSGTYQSEFGFQVAIRVTDKMINFFRHANLGQVNPNDPTSKPLNECIPLLTEQGITTPSILTLLFSIYAQVNNLNDRASCNHVDPNNLQSPLLPMAQRNRHRLGADDLLATWFHETFDRLRAKGPRQTRNGEIPAFDPKNFYYAEFQRIIAENRRTRDGTIHRHVQLRPGSDEEQCIIETNPAGPALTQEEQLTLKSPTIQQALKTEFELVKLCYDLRKSLNH